MSRFQLSLNVTDVDTAVDYYQRLFGLPPAKHRPGYANFIVVDPPMKLVLIEGEGTPGTINHVGIEVDDSAAVDAEAARLTNVGLLTKVDPTHTCCYATQDKVWTEDPDQVPWEVYAVVAEADHFGARGH